MSVKKSEVDLSLSKNRNQKSQSELQQAKPNGIKKYNKPSGLLSNMNIDSQPQLQVDSKPPAINDHDDFIEDDVEDQKRIDEKPPNEINSQQTPTETFTQKYISKIVSLEAELLAKDQELAKKAEVLETLQH